MTVLSPSGTARRSDAARNRQAILAAARLLFGEKGLAAPFDEIARGAGVGNATLYRHFPTLCDLVGAVFADTLQQVVDGARAALANQCPWEAFAGHVTFLCQLQADNRGLADLLVTHISKFPELVELRQVAYDYFDAISDRAKAAGELRQDFQREDLVLLLMGNLGVLARAQEAAPDAWQRYLAHFLRGLRVGPSPAVPSAAVPDLASFLPGGGS